jgi:predicted O-methyltransferase YrrM
MKRCVLLAGVLVALAVATPAQRRGLPRTQAAEAPSLAKTEAEKRILAALDHIRGSGEVYLEVPVADGKMLRLLTEAAGAKNVVEIGTSTGYSGLWFCLALQTTGGKLTTFEIDPGRAAEARGHFEQAGVSQMVKVIEGDAHENVKRLKEPIDVVFIDADKSGYLDYLNKLLPLVRSGGLILAHNIDSAPDYVKAITSSPGLETVFYMQGAGLGITLKKR